MKLGSFRVISVKSQIQRKIKMPFHPYVYIDYLQIQLYQELHGDYKKFLQ